MQAYTSVSKFICIWALFALAATACGWDPVARPVHPERVLTGAYTIEDRLDDGDHYVLLSSPEGSGVRFSILDVHRRKTCLLPKGTTQADMVLAPPTDLGDPNLAFKILLVVATSADRSELQVSTADCTVTGPFGEVGHTPRRITMDDDQRQIVLWRTTKRELMLLDPWDGDGKTRSLAKNVDGFDELGRPASGGGKAGEQALWLIEGGKLTQRKLDGTLVLARGEDVTDFSQAAFDTARVAFVDGGHVYEAAGPDFDPFMIAEGCNPFYYGTTLNLYSPCDPEQLIRFDLVMGTTEMFQDGVYWSYTDGGVLLELAHDPKVKDKKQLFITPPDGKRTEVKPYLRAIQVIDHEHLAGISEDRQFGVWSLLPTPTFTPHFTGVDRIDPFIDVRSGKFVWLMLDLDKKNTGLGRLTVFDENDFSLKVLATNVPTTGYSVEKLDLQVSEPVVVSIEDVTDTKKIHGKLRARLLSGELASDIDDNVSSYHTLILPHPGIMYTVPEGASRGLWFAAL